MSLIDLSRAIYAPRANPLDYPSAIVPGPTLVLRDRVIGLRAAGSCVDLVDDSGVGVDRLLAEAGAAPLAARAAQVAFGAHRNIENLAWKFADHIQRTGRTISQAFVMLPAHLANADVVACNLSAGGHMYSGLLTTREDLGIRTWLLGTKCPVAVVLLDPAQMEAMHEMAGVQGKTAPPPAIRCDVAQMRVHLDDGATCEAQTYGVAVPFLALDDRPIAFSAVRTSGRSGYRAMSQEEMFREINRVLAAEPVSAGVTPIIDTVLRRRRELIEAGLDTRVNQVPLFHAVRERLATRYALKDEDGRVRLGIEDVHPVRDARDAWAFEPLFRPA